MNELPQERLTIGIHACAHAEFMFEETRSYVMQRKAYGKTLSNLQVCRAFFSQAFAVHQQIDRVFPDCAAQISRNEDGNLCESCLHRSVYRSPFARTVGSCDGFHGQSLVSVIEFYLFVTELVIIDRLGHRNWSVK